MSLCTKARSPTEFPALHVHYNQQIYRSDSAAQKDPEYKAFQRIST